MEQVLNNFLGSIELGAKQVFGNLSIFPLRSRLVSGFEYVTLKEALTKNFLRVSEINACGSMLHAKLSSGSPTGAMRDAFESNKEQLDAYQGSFPLQKGQQGMLVLLGGQVAGLDILSKPEAYESLQAKLVQSYAIAP